MVAAAPNWSRHSRQVWPLRNSFATMQTGRGRSPDRLAAAGVVVATELKFEIDGHDMAERQAVEHGAIRRATA